MGVPVHARMMPTQLAIDEKMATVGQTAHMRFGDGMPAKTYIKAKD